MSVSDLIMQKTHSAIPFARVQCSGNEFDYVNKVLSSGWLTTGAMCAELESVVAKLVGCEFALAVNSCTAGLHLAVEALGIQPGDKVLVPTLTFTASAEILRYLGADPILVDVDFDTKAVTPEIIESALIKHPECKAVVVVHFAGQACAMLDSDREGIVSVCKKRGVKVIEDAAHALPASDQGRPVGALGEIGCLSFYANKNITTGEGGMVLTNNSEIAERVSLMRLHGIDRTVWNRFTDTTNSAWEYDVVSAGYKYNLADLNAAVGLAQLEQIDTMHEKRVSIAKRYLEELQDLPVSLPVVRGAVDAHAWHLFAIVVGADASISRDQLIDSFAQENIGLSVHYKPLHRLSYYKNLYLTTPEMFPQAEKIWKGSVSLPIYPSLTYEEQSRVIERLYHYLA